MRFAFSWCVAADNRCGYYRLIDASGDVLYVANTDANDLVPTTYFRPDDGGEILDDALDGPGPELLRFPQLPPGDYRVCSENRLRKFGSGDERAASGASF